MTKDEIKISTKNELEARNKQIEQDFNKVRDELADYIESTKVKIEEMTKKMDALHNEYLEITTEINKRDGKLHG